MIASKMSKLKKMKMPEKKGEEMEEGMEMESKDPMDPELEGQEEDLGLDLDADMEAGEPTPEKLEGPGKNAATLEAVSDDELMAELKKRGLMSELDKSAEEEAPSDEQEIYS